MHESTKCEALRLDGKDYGTNRAFVKARYESFTDLMKSETDIANCSDAVEFLEKLLDDMKDRNLEKAMFIRGLTDYIGRSVDNGIDSLSRYGSALKIRHSSVRNYVAFACMDNTEVDLMVAWALNVVKSINGGTGVNIESPSAIMRLYIKDTSTFSIDNILVVSFDFNNDRGLCGCAFNKIKDLKGKVDNATLDELLTELSPIEDMLESLPFVRS